MELMDDPIKYFLAISGIVLSGLVFLFYAISIAQKRLSVDGFLISDKQVSGAAFSNTFASSTLSLATTIIFFIEAHRLYGWLMALGPMFFIAVQFILLKLITNLKLDLTKIRTIPDLWHSVFPNKTIARNLSFITVATCIMTMCLEIIIGSEILSVFLPAGAFWNTAAFFSISILVLGYVYYGGYRAIIETDKWQLTLLILATIAFVYFAFAAPIVNENLKSGDFGRSLFSYSESGWSLCIFIVWACVINFCIGFTDICVWQRMSASRSTEESYKELFRGIWKFIFIFLVPMLCFIAIYTKGHMYGTMPEFLTLVFKNSGAAGYIVFPLIVTGFSAALFSTADTFMIASIYGLCDKNTFLPTIRKMPSLERDAIIRKYLTIFSITLFVFLTAFYYMQQHRIAEWIMPIVYAVWGQVAIIAPLPIYALYRTYKGLPVLQVSKLSSNVLLTFIYIGWAIILYGSVAGNHSLPQLTLIIGLLIVCIGLATSTYLCNNKIKSANNKPKLEYASS